MDTGTPGRDEESRDEATPVIDESAGDSIHVLMPRVMKAVGAIHKDRTNAHHGFNFRGIDDVMTAVQPALIEHGVYYTYRVLEHEQGEYRTSNNNTMRTLLATVEYTFHGPRGDKSDPIVSIGEGADSADKPASKALAMALKYALLHALCVPTGDPDPDGQTVEGPGGGRSSRRSSSSSRSSSRSAPAQPKPSGIAPTVQGWLDSGIGNGVIIRLAADAAHKHGEKPPGNVKKINTDHLSAEALSTLSTMVEEHRREHGEQGAKEPEEAAQPGSVAPGEGGCSKHPDKADPECSGCQWVRPELKPKEPATTA